MIVTSSPVVQQSAAGRTYTGTWREKVRFSNVTDGLSNTFLAGEMHVPEQNLNQIPFNGPVLNGAELDNHSRIGGPGVPLLSGNCLLYTSPSPRDQRRSRMPSSA